MLSDVEKYALAVSRVNAGWSRRQEQSAAEFNRFFWEQVGWDIVKRVAFWTGVVVIAVATLGYGIAILANRVAWTAARAAMQFALSRYAAWELTAGGLALGYCRPIARGIMGFVGQYYPGVSVTIQNISRSGLYMTRSGIMRYLWHEFAIVGGRFIVDPTKWNIIDVILW